MATNWTPDDDTAQIFNRYREALETERTLKPTVQSLALDALKAGATITQLARLTGMTAEVFRRTARKHDIPIDKRYQERAERLRGKIAEAKASPLFAEPESQTAGLDPVAVAAEIAEREARKAIRASSEPPVELNVDPRTLHLDDRRLNQLAGWFKQARPTLYAAAIDNVPAEQRHWIRHVAISAGIECDLIHDSDLRNRT